MLAGSTKRGHAAYSRVHEILRQIEREWSAELGPKLFAQLKELLFRVSKPVNALAGLCLAVPLSCKWSSSLERRYSRCADCPHRTHSLGRERWSATLTLPDYVRVARHQPKFARVGLKPTM